jgi:uncharacterized repeat protein (TIGR01451 family)
VQLAYAAATGQVAPLPYPLPPTANGSGFIDELSWLFVPPPRVDFWGADWEAYRPAAADNQISYHCTAHPTSCLCELGLFGLSAAEVPAPSLVTATQIYTPFGVGGQHVTIANDSLWTIGVPVAVPHYAPLIASLHPTAAIRMWDWLIDDGPFSPLNNIESHMFPPDSSCDASALQWNQLKGSWNLALQTLGWGRYLAQRAGQEPILWQAMISNTLLKQGYDILATPAAVQIAGPTTGAIDTPYTFTATLSHDSTTSPITYSWHVTGQGRPVTHTGGLSDTITFTWPTVGPRVITVTVDNVGGIPVTDTHSIAVRVPPNGVQVRGPALGATDTVYTFTAEVIPITTTLPVTYVWRATGYNAPILNTGGLSSTVTYTWPMTGTPVVTVTAANGNGRVVTGTHVISIIVPSLSVHKAGPAAAAAGERITYTIQVTNHSILTLTATITDELPGGVDATDVMTTWSPVTIAPHAVWTEHVAVTVTGEFLGVLTNILRVTTLEGVGDMARTRTCVPGCRQYLPLIFSNW